jgi:hypothetical protein
MQSQVYSSSALGTGGVRERLYMDSKYSFTDHKFSFTDYTVGCSSTPILTPRASDTTSKDHKFSSADYRLQFYQPQV